MRDRPRHWGLRPLLFPNTVEPHVRPPLVSDHPHKRLPIEKNSQSLTVGTSSKRPPPVSDQDHFLGLTVNIFHYF